MPLLSSSQLTLPLVCVVMDKKKYQLHTASGQNIIKKMLQRGEALYKCHFKKELHLAVYKPTHYHVL
jgi:hypothetical protein